MKPRPGRTAIAALAGLAVAALVSGCTTPVGPVSVTRFHVDPAPLARGPLRVVPAPGMDAASPLYRDYAMALARQLSALGYDARTRTDGTPGPAQIAVLSIEQASAAPPPRRGPVSVGVGGSTGSYGSGLGLGVGINLAGRPKPAVTTRLHVMIRKGPDGPTVWEGRASFTVPAGSPLSSTSLAAPKMAQALLKGFPGQSGETIEVP